MIAAYLAWNDVVDMHLALICATQLAHPAITIEHAFTLHSVSSAVELV
jgi:hypothetical protein